MSEIACPMCGALRPPLREGQAWSHCLSCQGMVFSEARGPQVLIVHESQELAEQIGTVLLDASFWPLHAASGGQALDLAGRWRPQAAVVDVALRDTLSFQLVGAIRARCGPRTVRVVLIASIYSCTAYKRRPTSLYGADDYVEQHHIHDLLPRKLSSLLGGITPQVNPMLLERWKRIREGEIRSALRGRERVAVLARSIVADIALYHEQEFMQYRRDRDIRPLSAALQEGRRLLLEMTDAEDQPVEDPIVEAFTALVSGMRQT